MLKIFILGKDILRITGGKYRGVKINCPPGTIRPVMSRMRESFFSILGNLEGLAFLDLFSGSGVMALEAASRGAERVHAVEKDTRKRNVLKQNLHIAEENCSMSLMSAELFIAQYKKGFSIVFLDPPFAYRHRNDILQRLINSAIPQVGTEVCIHFPREDTLSDTFRRSDGMLTMTCHRGKNMGSPW